MRKFKIKNTLKMSVCLLTAVLFAGCTDSGRMDAVPTTITLPATEPTLAATATPTVTPTPGPDFYRVSGTDIVDSNGTAVQLKGMAMGNMIWGYYDPPENDHNEDSYRELAELGFNCVRFYLSYHFFETDAAPYVYKESGFDWLDENIAWAKKYGIRLVLNMHAPQGGYQSQGDGLALWQEEENQNRLIALWTEIARRYADEETIVGYGLINEPVVPLLADIPSTVSQCSSLMQRITDSIRTVDNNHIIFVERLSAAVDTTTGEADWNLTYDDVLFLIDDPNTVYEFHCYAPHQFTHQNMTWAGTADKVTTYPSEDPGFQDVISYWTGCNWSEPIESLEDGWQLYESGFASLSDTGNAGCITLRAANTGADGTVLFDDIVVEEYQNGVFQRIVTTLDFDKETHVDDFYYWSADGSGSYYYTEDNGNRCVALSGTTDDANATGYRFPLREGYEYKVCGKVKQLNTDSDCQACPRIDYSLFETITYVDYDYLESQLLPYIEFGQKNQVPIYLGEFGVCYPAWESNAGAAQWVTDMLTLCEKYQLHFDYHAYQDYWFGLYRYPMDDPGSKRNEELAEIFERMLE